MIEHVVSVESDIQLPEVVTTAAILSLMTHVLTSEAVGEVWQLGIQFVDDATIQAAHKEFMNIDESTDIMTFPYTDDDDVWGESEPGGDLMISIDTARENASAADWSVADELFFLVTHGLLHLLGWKDNSTGNRAAMLTHQQELMASWVDRP